MRTLPLLLSSLILLASVVYAAGPGDANDDGSVGLADLILIGANWGLADFDQRADLNGDGSVGLGDLILVGANFGKTYDDPGSSTDGCGNWQTDHPEWLWCDDFESSSIDGEYDDVEAGNGGFDISTDDSFSGSQSLRQHYTSGQVDAGWLSWAYADYLDGNYGDFYDDIYVRWYHNFEDGFDGFPPKMARIRSRAAGYSTNVAVLYWIAEDSSDYEIVADILAPDSSQANSAGWLALTRSDFNYADSANVGRWVCHEMRVRKNSPGQSDGIVQYWADNELIIDKRNVDLVGSTSDNFNEVMIDGYWNGGSPKAQNRYFDDLVISTQRIGC